MTQILNEGPLKERFYASRKYDDAIFENALRQVIEIVISQIDRWEQLFPESATVQGKYPLCSYYANPGKNGRPQIADEKGINVGWTTGFWTGILHLISTTEECDQQTLLPIIRKQVDSFLIRIDEDFDLNTHDIGFLYILSVLADYKLHGNEDSKTYAIQAADVLMRRYLPAAGILQAWGEMSDPAQAGRLIIDCMMNIPLLYWAADQTANPIYYDAAYSHAKQAAKYVMRGDGSTYHTFFFDSETGKPKYGKTFQGYSDDSCWARGQAWGIYGFTLSYLYTGDRSFLDSAEQVADYFLERLPQDSVVYWDLVFEDGSDQEKDSSAAAIAACGLLELAKHLPLSHPKRESYEQQAVIIMESLSKSYTSKEVPHANGLLLHGVYDKNSNKGVDESTIWGDYFYVEGLVRLSQSWYMYW